MSGTATGRGPVILRNHLADLRRSGLTDDTIRVAGVYSESDPARVSTLLDWEHPATNLGSCLVFPFIGRGGHSMHYQRVKPDKPREVNGKPAKYESPRGRPNRVYLPPLARDAIDSPTTRLIITEGEKKSLAADQHGYACVGLVGVWGWVKAREDEDAPREMNEDLAQFKWSGRAVYLVLDSDAAYKRGPQQAEYELAKELTARGALVRVVRLPARLGGPKVGLDDYLLTGAAGFAELLARSAPPTLPPVGFSNTALAPNPDGKDGETTDLPRSAEAMAAELVGASGGWPRFVGSALVVPDQCGGVRPLDNPHQLFAYLGSVFGRSGISGVSWGKANGCVTKQEFYEHLAANCERFDRVERLPHVPPIPNVLYLGMPAVPDGKFEALERFLSFFAPATETDAALLLSCLLTPLWGGPPGKRPAFLFEAEEDDTQGGRGVGKSTVAQKIAAVFGGAFAIDAAEPFTRTVSRLLTPSAAYYRVLLMDNVKTFRLSSAELESLITSPDVNGHRLYKGQAAVPNYYTLLITLNGPSLSRDAAQRVAPVRFKRPKYRSGWETEIDGFLAGNRARLIADLVGVMRRTPAKLSRVTRWGEWETEVLARVEFPDRCMKLIEERTGEMDADREDADRIRETFLGIAARSLSCSDAHTRRFLLTSAAITNLVETALNRWFSAADACAQMKALGVKGFKKSDRNGRRLWLWQGDAVRSSSDAEAPPIVSYDPEKEAWFREDESRGIGD